MTLAIFGGGPIPTLPALPRRVMPAREDYHLDLRDPRPAQDDDNNDDDMQEGQAAE